MAVIKRSPLPGGDDVLGKNREYRSIHDIYAQAEAWNLRTNPIDIEALIKMHGIRIVREEMADDMSGYLELRHTNWVIGINKYQNPRRQRFTLAHEFAHFLFDREDFKDGAPHQDQILLRTEESNPIERRAHEFAASLLMPQEEFRKCIDSGIRDVAQLAEKFDVSMAAVRYRAYRLGIIREY